jgi:hypothetical protein
VARIRQLSSIPTLSTGYPQDFNEDDGDFLPRGPGAAAIASLSQSCIKSLVPQQPGIDIRRLQRSGELVDCRVCPADFLALRPRVIGARRVSGTMCKEVFVSLPLRGDSHDDRFDYHP